MTGRKLQALRNLAERPGTEAEGKVAREMLAKAEAKDADRQPQTGRYVKFEFDRGFSCLRRGFDTCDVDLALRDLEDQIDKAVDAEMERILRGERPFGGAHERIVEEVFFGKRK